MSDTPRTQARVRYMIDNNISPEGLEHWANDLERELNAANERIKRLEEGGDEAICPLEYASRVRIWTKVKDSQ